jgi:flagellar P-ring protein precursor FlgI
VLASGIVATGGFGAQGKTTKVTRNYPTIGSVSRGGRIVEALEPDLLSEAGDLELLMRNPSLRTAHNVADGVNRLLGDSGVAARAHDESLVRIGLPEAQRTRDGVLRVLALIQDVRVAVEHPSKVVVHQDTGTILAGAGVQISPCVVAMSDLTVTVVSEEEVVQPPPGWRNPGTTERVDRSVIEITTTDSELKELRGGGATVGELLGNLKALGLTPRQLIEVFKQLDAGGYLHAPLEVR